MIRVITSALFVISVAATAPAHSAAYLKYDGVKGESTKGNTNTPNNDVKSNEAPKPAGLLVPAIQKVREAPKASGETKKKGNVEYEWKVEKGEK